MGHGPSRATTVVLRNARVLTSDPRRPQASFVALQGDRIVGVGDDRDLAAFTNSSTRGIDCQGMTLVPGFCDAHCHLLALASSLLNLDCGPDRVGSIAQIRALVREEAARTTPGRWIKAFGYDDQRLAEKRHPTRLDLDEAAPFHPVRLKHRSGHATLLNSQAMALLGLSRSTPDPVEGVVQRDASGEPTGLFLEMNAYLGKLVEPHRDAQEFLSGVARANQLLLSMGITSVQDAGPDNDLLRWDTFRWLKAEGQLTSRVTMMVGQNHAGAFLAAGLAPSAGDQSLRLGAAKVMLTLTTGAMHPSLEELKERVMRLHQSGFQVAVHAVEQAGVEAALDALDYAQRTLPRPDARHRLEHASECPPPLVERLRAGRHLVVTQPGFVYHNGDSYLSLAPQEMRPHLYPLGALAAASVPLAFGSDAPVIYPHPLLDIYAAATRKTVGGAFVGTEQAISPGQALRAYTLGAAYAAFQEGELGSIAPGKLADLVLLSDDPTAVAPEQIKDIRVMMTMIGGQVVWEG